MQPIVTIIAPGSMGSGVGQRLSGHGVRVLTSLTGRSAASVRRATAAGMQDAENTEIAASDFILSIVPPGDAANLARRLAPLLAGAARKPIYVDCNAVSPATVKGIAEIIAPTGAPFVDVGIIGGPPRPDGYSPVFYTSGPEAQRVRTLHEYGLDVQVLDDGVGTASALKMSYAGITKGLTAIGTAMMLAASRAGVAEALVAELKSSQPIMFNILSRTIPGMYSKAYRWVAEMHEIGAFAGDDEDADRIYEGVATLYERMAADVTGANRRTAALDALLKDR